MNKKAHQSEVLINSAIESTDRKAFLCSDQEALANGHSLPSKKLVRQILLHIGLTPDARVLHIGSGAGYFTSILSKLARQVYTIEKSVPLATLAENNFKLLGLENIEVHQGEGSLGLAKNAPYEVIIVSSPSITDKTELFKQLTAHGQLICLEKIESVQLMLVRYSFDENQKLIREELGVVDFSHNNIENLIDLDIINDELLTKARQRAEQNQSDLLEELFLLIHLEDESIYKSLAQQSGLVLGNVDNLLTRINPELFATLSPAFLQKHQLIPIAIESGVLKVATTIPDAQLHGLESAYPKTPIEKILITPTDFHRLWSALDLTRQSKSLIGQYDSDTTVKPSEDLLDLSHTQIASHLVAMFEALLLDAVAYRASDIHLEHYGQRIRVRMRVDGSLRDLAHYRISPKEYLGLVNVIKLRAELNIAEKRLPQGGRMRMKAGGHPFDLRIQVQPCLHGEHVIIRLLEQSDALIGIEELGFSPFLAQHYRRLFKNPSGLVLVVGPTGSGKSTTLYAGLRQLSQDSTRKVITVEDPIEYSIDNIQQTRVRPDIGFNFSDAMRSFVRQDPDVILVGEIRDTETALEAIRASQTGHLVLSTLHSNDAVDALQRLYDLEIEANSISSELLAVIAQRLAKKICPHCREQVEPDPEIMAELFPQQTPNNFRCFAGKGCSHCDNQGTKGRIAVFEYLQINPDLRKAISLKMPVVELRQLALDTGLVTMRSSALEHVTHGIIPLDELPRILSEERMAPEKRGPWSGV